MKILIAIALSCIAGSASAQHLSGEDYSRLLLKNKESFEKVVPGMYAKYLQVWKKSGDDNEWCETELENEVISIPNSGGSYEVLEKVSYLNDCGDFLEGTVRESIKQRNLVSVEEEANHIASEGTYLLAGKLISSFRVIRSDDSDPGYDLVTTWDLDQSQFFRMSREISKWRHTVLIKRDFVGH
jgi:hypothetical protein